jgi:tRNA (uracil-5-)-methyltransferase TRM9
MQNDVVQKLINLNQQFYQTFGKAFAATRRRIQPGVRQVLEGLPITGDWLDIGCGNGQLALEWSNHTASGTYTGLDFSEPMLEEARLKMKAVESKTNVSMEFKHADLADPRWDDDLRSGSMDGVLAFAVMHHIPGRLLRGRILRQIHRVLKKDGAFIHSEWQFDRSPKLMARIQPWECIGITEAEVDPGDTVLDWRYALPGQDEKIGLRYVHLFQREELVHVAADNGFEIVQEFESDGRGGMLSLYQVWKKRNR